MNGQEFDPGERRPSLGRRILSTPGVKPGLAIGIGFDILRYGEEMPHNMAQFAIEAIDIASWEIAFTGLAVLAVNLIKRNHRNEQGN